MEKLIEELVAKGLSKAALNSMSKAQLFELAKAFKADPSGAAPRDPVQVIVGKTGALYACTGTYTVQKYKDGKPVAGETSPTRNLYVRVDAIDQIIEDLLEAKSLAGIK